MITIKQKTEAATVPSLDNGGGEKMSRSKSFFHRAMSVRTVSLLRSTELSNAGLGDDDDRDGGGNDNSGRRSRSLSRRSSSRASTTTGSRRRALSRWSASLRSSTESLRSSSGSLGRSFRKKSGGGSAGGVKKLERDDVEVGKLLGRGGFNHVYEVTNVRRPSLLGSMGDGKVSVDPTGDDARRTSCPSNFVVKHLSPSCFEDEDTFRTAAVDLALEAKLLSKIDHPNVIKLHGVTKGCVVSAFSSEDDAGYFLMLDKLECTLVERAGEWRDEVRKLKSRRRSSLDGMLNVGTYRARRAALLRVRMDAALQMARGMSYLHGRRIIYRDMKPGNVGFDSSGIVKIFDFGLSRELPPDCEDGERRFTGIVGTPRYMAPEIARCESYGLPADVYSFGLLLWEICALERPFPKYTARDLQEKVAYGTKRPKIPSKWSEPLRDLIGRCWHGDPKVRPVFRDVVQALVEEIQRVEREGVTGNETDVSNHSFLSDWKA